MKNKTLTLILLIAGLVIGLSSSATAYTSPTEEKVFYSNGSVYDFSENAVDGEINGSVGVVTGFSNSSGEWDLDSDSSFEAFDFNTDTQYVLTRSLNFTGDYSISFYAKADSTSQPEFTGLFGSVANGVTNATRDGTNSFQIGFDGSGNYRLNGNDKTTIGAASTSYEHIVLTYDDSADNTKVYFNGVKVINKTSTANKVHNIITGNNRNGDKGFDGKIDEFHFYKQRVLTQTEAQNLKNYNQLTQPSSNSEPSINSVEYEVSGSWVTRGSLGFNDQVTRIRANITDPDGDAVSSTSLSLTDLYDSNTRVSGFSHTSTSGDYFIFDVSDQTLDDSGNWETTVEATDSNSNTGSTTDSWSLNWGTLSATLNKPSTDVQVNQYETFNMTGTATCSGGECSSEGERVELWADPKPVDGSVKLASHRGQVLPGDEVEISGLVKPSISKERQVFESGENLLDKILGLVKGF